MSGVISVRPRPKDGKPIDPTSYPYSLPPGTSVRPPSIHPPPCPPPPYPPPDVVLQCRQGPSANVKTEYIDREVEVPVTKVVHKIIEIPVPQKTVNKPVVKTVQKIVEVPQVEYVDKYVDVPVKKYVEVVKEVRVPQVVKKYVEKVVEAGRGDNLHNAGPYKRTDSRYFLASTMSSGNPLSNRDEGGRSSAESSSGIRRRRNCAMPVLTRCPECSFDEHCSKCLLDFYTGLCDAYGSKVDPAFVTALVTRWSQVVMSLRSPLDSSVMPVLQTVGEAPFVQGLHIGTHLSRGWRGEGNWIARALQIPLPHLATSLKKLDLQRLGIDGHGARQLAEGVVQLKSLKDLILSHNYLGYEDGHESVVRIVEEGPRTLHYLDISFNAIGYLNVRKIMQAVDERNKVITDGMEMNVAQQDRKEEEKETSGEIAQATTETSKHEEEEEKRRLMPFSPHSSCCCHCRVNVDGNFVVEEIWNALTHGLGVVLIVPGLIDLMVLTSNDPFRCKLAVITYMMSCTLLFAVSTLFHAFFMLDLTSRIFQVLDHSSIFVLIAGSYTPFCVLLFGNDPNGSRVMSAEWALAGVGITAHIIAVHFPNIRHSPLYVYGELILYVIMGWMALAVYDTFVTSTPVHIQYLIAGGGVTYMAGLPFYILDNIKCVPILHCVWHLFVLIAAIIHFCAVRESVIYFNSQQSMSMLGASA
ncbi:hypothetical protein FOZ62_023561 [Perkinsus olseni]|uniref:Uncharacterized protein n=1 Tax=Perkinsus olseni TaxID=32597 RepID=A0A7J6P1F1_PEROL|nr:hypothetical protein FOZ62_023561 [Perkinsus olseni]